MNIRSDPSDQGAGHEPPDADLHAGEYVLGVLDAPARRAAQLRIEAEPAFARLVADWQQRLSAFITEIEPVAAPAHVWLRVRSQLGWSPVEGARRGLWQNINVWRGATAAAFAAAAALAVVFFVRPLAPTAPSAPTPVALVTPPPAPVREQPKPVVVLARDDGRPGWLAAIDAADGAVTMTPVPSPADPDGRVGELWLIPVGGAPQSLGFVSSERAHTVEVPDALLDRLVAGATLAVTLEPEAGIPHAAPTGPIVAKGNITTI